MALRTLTDDPIEVIAATFTGPLVIFHSISLEKGGINAEMAKRYFEARDKLGITGYMSCEEAMRVLRNKLTVKTED